MAFIQMMERHTDRVDELTALEEEWQRATAGRRTLRRTIVARDRANPKRHLVLAFFDSYESAMANSELPETTEFAQRQEALMDAPIVFTDLDVLEDQQVDGG
jgi:hypothetical protein